MPEVFAPTLAAARCRIAAVRPADYARTRNALNGAVTGLSPYITHGLVSLPEVLAGVAARHVLTVQHKFVFELGWREYFRHVWHHRGGGIFHSLHQGPLPDDVYLKVVPDDIQAGCTGVAVVDRAVRVLHDTGMLHNHARLWLASYVVHVRKVHWRAGADWLYGHLLDGDLASNHLSWQWVAGTSSRKPYLFNADNVARHAPPDWHSPGSAIDVSYEALEHMARQPFSPQAFAHTPLAAQANRPSSAPPVLMSKPPDGLGLTAPDVESLEGQDVWLVHPWSLGELPAALPPETRVIGVFVADFHRDRPWSARRWHFAGSRMAALAAVRWYGDVTEISAALARARRVQSVFDPHLAPWLPQWATCAPSPTLFPYVDSCCDSFSQWWTRVTRGLHSAHELLSIGDPMAE